MKTKALALLVAAISIILFTIGCDKDEAAGPQGPTGPTGNANVITIIDTIDASSWVYYEALPFRNWKALINIPEVTQEVVDNGVVLVYLYSITGNSSYGWLLLPYGNPQQDWSAFYYLNTIEINNITAITFPPNPGTRIFKIVIVPAP